jgi:hypothetical protein
VYKDFIFTYPDRALPISHGWGNTPDQDLQVTQNLQVYLGSYQIKDITHVQVNAWKEFSSIGVSKFMEVPNPFSECDFFGIRKKGL